MPNLSRNKFNISLIFFFVMVIVVSFFVGRYSVPTEATGSVVFNEAWNDIFSKYVDLTKLNSDNMTRAAIEGIISTLGDRYTAYLTQSELNQFMTGLQGQYVGIGVVISIQNEKIEITSVLPDSPAEKAGIKSGDTILEINGESVAGLSFDTATEKIRGPENTPVNLLILHQNETAPVTLEITRASLNLPSIYYQMQGDIAHINILQFTERTEDELVPVIKQLKTANAKGIVLDLRGNPGGLLDIVVQVASNFISGGVIVKVKSNAGVVETQKAVAGLEITDLPMVVLVDNNSASGAEVLAGALQDHGRALIAGTVTYGKGSVDQMFQLSDGTGIYITVARWLTPNDRLIEGQGIQPDVTLALTGDTELQWAIDYLSGH